MKDGFPYAWHTLSVSVTRSGLLIRSIDTPNAKCGWSMRILVTSGPQKPQVCSKKLMKNVMSTRMNKETLTTSVTPMARLAFLNKYDTMYEKEAADGPYMAMTDIVAYMASLSNVTNVFTLTKYNATIEALHMIAVAVVSHAKVDSQYAGIETPEISCWCFTCLSRSRTINSKNDAGMNANENIMMRQPTMPSALFNSVISRFVNGNGCCTALILSVPPE